MNNINLAEAKKLHAACYDAGLTVEEARLMLYIHAKAKQGKDLREGSQIEIEALCVMLGLSDLKKELSEFGIKGYLNEIGDTIGELDKIFKSKHGVEAYMRGQLNDQLRFHINRDYRERYLNIYEAKIALVIDGYDDEKISKAFEKFQQKDAELNKKLNDSLNQ